MAEQRYQAVLAVISDGLTISQVAQKVGVSRQMLHAWLARYDAEGLEGLGAASSASSSTSQVVEPLPQHRWVTEDAREMRPQRLDVDQRFVDVEDDGRGWLRCHVGQAIAARRR